jgi:hypothetical protein
MGCCCEKQTGELEPLNRTAPKEKEMIIEYVDFKKPKPARTYKYIRKNIKYYKIYTDGSLPIVSSNERRNSL